MKKAFIVIITILFYLTATSPSLQIPTKMKRLILDTLIGRPAGLAAQ